MKSLILTILITCLAIMGLKWPVWAEMATIDEALTVANNWITVIIQNKGNWGGAETAEVEEIQEFKRGERVLGYFCRVRPKGFIVLSPHKALAPIKAYSATSDLDPECDEGMADLIKGGMERVLRAIEKRVGTIEKVQTEDLQNMLEINYRQSWDELGGNALMFKKGLESGAVEMDYQEGEVLLSSAWSQGDPYNLYCPSPDDVGDDDCTEDHCLVGCTATAAAQIMRYWNWPPLGTGLPYLIDEYHWEDMPDRLTASSPQSQINAVAELCYEIGMAVGMNFCESDECQSSIPTYDMEPVYENYFHYSTACRMKVRNDYNASEWFDLLKTQFNANRPVHYRVEDHSIVGDGWRISGGLKQYHMNYGWGGNASSHCPGITNTNAWYTLDALCLGGIHEEYILERIYPAQALGNSISGTYPLESFFFRYFDRDATGNSAVFESGQFLQFLPRVTVKCTGSSSILFYGSSPFNTTWLFTRGIINRGIRICNGGIKLHQNGSLTLR